MNYKDKKILIVGMGKSGLSAANFFISRGARITGYDRKYIKKAESKIGDRVNLILDTAPENIKPCNYDLIVTSPGVKPDNYILKKAFQDGVPVISEMEAGYRELPGVKVVAVTGTNGKTTTCRMIENLISGRAVVAGNIGLPLTSRVDKIKTKDILILEVSSYQIPYTPSLKPDIGIILNLFPEHLEWHGNFENYVKAKKKMFSRQSSGQVAVFNNEMKELNNFTEGLKSKKYFFSLTEHQRPGCYLKNNQVIWREKSGDKEKLVSLSDFPLKGGHNIENWMASLGAVKQLNKGRKIDTGFKSFKLPSHRLEEFKVSNGVTFVNDSKATNTDSTVRALESYESPIFLLMGGKSKDSFHPRLVDKVNDKVRKLILFGQSRHKLARHFKKIDSSIKVQKKGELKRAVNLTVSEIERGDTVLFSPGGSSFDEFKNYKERGNKFKKWVKEAVQ